MSKKKISQIVGLTIGATAIAATGIGSSIALTSCTAPASETDTSISLTTEQVGMAFSAVKEYLESLHYDQISAPKYLESPITQSVLKQAIASKLEENQVNGFNETNVASLSFTAGSSENDSGYAEAGFAVSQISITFSNVNLPTDLGDSGYTVNPDNAMEVSQDVSIDIPNPAVVDLDNTKAEALYQAVQEYIQSLKTDYFKSTETLNNAPQVVSTATQKAAEAAGISPTDIQDLSFSISGNAEDSQNASVGFSVEFQPNITLTVNNDSSYFDTPAGQTLTTSQGIEVANPNYQSGDVVLSGGNGAAIYGAVQTAINNKIQADSNLMQLQQPESVVVLH